MSDDKKREAMKRLGADIGPDTTKLRLISFIEMNTSGIGVTVLNVIFPAKRHWWGGSDKPRAGTYIGSGTCWFRARLDAADQVYRWGKFDEPVGPITSALLAGLWVKREKVVERKP